jgi:hypothetical protein
MKLLMCELSFCWSQLRLSVYARGEYINKNSMINFIQTGISLTAIMRSLKLCCFSLC